MNPNQRLVSSATLAAVPAFTQSVSVHTYQLVGRMPYCGAIERRTRSRIQVPKNRARDVVCYQAPREH